ncbi:MAG: acyl-CoA/acyl-ACP dehydrogenase [Desulfobacteraceae bacterium]|jgi:acyl-CoA dehydrogenase|nr:acyl-CoA/acyl-ACP dehydrogenase [Desulfobacteraceae bacterium]
MYAVEKYFWWNDAQKKLADEVAEFSDTFIASTIEDIEKTKRFPWEYMTEMGKKGWFGVLIPKEYGGMGNEYGITGMCIVLEEIARGAAIAVDFYETTVYGYSPIVRFGTEKQKKKWLPGLATGEHFACIAITEPFMGSDAANIQTTAELDGDEYVINGKKRFITVGGVGDLYCVYCQTSSSPEDRKSHRHLSAILVEKGTPGFSVEVIHDPMGRFGSRHAALNFENVRVPKENIILSEGDGWNILTDALNIERLGVAAGAIGVARSSLDATAEYVTRRVAFRQTLAEIPGVQNMGSDMVTGTSLMSLMTYYAARQLDQNEDVAIGANVAKIYATDNLTKITLDAIQCHGGDGYMRDYPVERHFRDSKLIEIGAGANEILKHLVWKQWLKKFQALRKSLRKKTVKKTTISSSEAKKAVLETLAEFYKVHPGLYTECDEILEKLEITVEDLNECLVALEEDKHVALYRKRGKITLAKATYDGLRLAKPQEYYLKFPDFVDKEKEIF